MRNIKNFLFIHVTSYLLLHWAVTVPPASLYRGVSRAEEMFTPLIFSKVSVPSQVSWAEICEENISWEISQTGKYLRETKEKSMKVLIRHKYLQTKHNILIVEGWPLRMVNANITEWTRRYSPKHIWARVTKTIATFGNIFHSILL